jgi:hypothetical protein
MRKSGRSNFSLNTYIVLLAICESFISATTHSKGLEDGLIHDLVKRLLEIRFED